MQKVNAMKFPLLMIVVGHLLSAQGKQTLRFPANFKLGVSTSSYQIEGGWNASDKGENVWDHFAHEKPSRIIDGSTGDVAADSYHKYKKDVRLLKDLGVDFYRISLSWSRILPNGFGNKISRVGLRYYKRLLDRLIVAGIEPVVTIYHWDHPYNLEELGGWTNDMMVTWFVDYARIVFEELGSRVKIFSTINEPAITCKNGYGEGIMAPGKKYPKHGPYLCMHNMLKAHAKTYKMYDSDYRNSQGGQVGIVIPCGFFYPKYPNDTETADIAAAFDWWWTAHPIFSEKGDYPAVMKQRIAENSELEGYPTSRLPEFTQAEIDEIRGSADYFGMNHYMSELTEPAPKSKGKPWLNDSGVITSYDPSWPRYNFSEWIRPMPQGFGDLLRQVKTLYNNPPVYVMENGISDDGVSLNDFHRIQYLHDYLRELLIAVNRDGCNVKMYAVWSFLDNIEWELGYTEHFGLVRVDFTNPRRPRTPKLSYKWYQKLIRSRKLLPVNSVSSES